MGMAKLYDRCKDCYIPLKKCPEPKCPTLENVLDAEARRMELLDSIVKMPSETKE
jgi:hypothetical protein